jgi:hypothetical protein
MNSFSEVPTEIQKTFYFEIIQLTALFNLNKMLLLLLLLLLLLFNCITKQNAPFEVEVTAAARLFLRTTTTSSVSRFCDKDAVVAVAVIAIPVDEVVFVSLSCVVGVMKDVFSFKSKD